MTLEVGPALINGTAFPDDDINGILHGWKWDTTASTLIYFEFPQSTTEYLDTGNGNPVQTGYEPGAIVGFQPFNFAQREAIGLILANVASFAKLTFTGPWYGPPDPLANYAASFRYAMATTIDYTSDGSGVHVPGNPPAPGTAEGNWPELPGNYYQGDAWFNATSYNSPAPGNYAYSAGLMHETGHLLGLKHGHTSQVAHGVTFPTLPANHDSLEYSIMTYRAFPGAPIPGGTQIVTPEDNFPQTFMQDDIAALQYMYGANYDYNSGDTTYSWSPDTGQLYINGIANGDQPSANRVFLTIWDGGGFDTYDFSNYKTNLKVDLNPGAWTILDTTGIAQRADLGATGLPGPDYYARGNIANARLYNGDTRSLIEEAIGGSGNDYLIGNSADNILKGGPGTDILDGGAGADTMYGGPGDDWYEVDNPGDVVVENPGEGTDRYDSYISIDALPANVENIVLYGSTDLYAIANDLPNVISGSLGNNGLYGMGGNDTIYGYAGNDWIDGDSLGGSIGDDRMIGGPGDDTYQVNSPGDVVIEQPGEGTDQIDSYLSLTLPANVENLVLYGFPNLNGTGNGLANVISGNLGSNILRGLAGNDSLYGYAGDDTLDGGTGADMLVGGTGNDTYFVDNSGDAVIEKPNEGTDLVRSSINYALPGNVENLSLTGSANIAGVGNGLANTIIGNTGNNTLDGRGGADTMKGGRGNDIYEVENAGDVVVEGLNQGTDRLDSYFSITLPANVEDLVLYGATNLNGTGNSLANVLNGSLGNNALKGLGGNDTLYGYAGNDTLDGGTGADTLRGGLGNDTYVLDNSGDKVIEAANQGTDTVRTAVSYVLPVNVENLTLLGSGNINATGNGLANRIIGNAGNNLLDGKAGNDVLTGAGGRDSFLFDTAPNTTTNDDRITDFTAADRVELDQTIFKGFGAAGLLPANAFFAGAAAHDATDRIIYNPAGSLFYDSDGTGPAAAVRFAELSGDPALTNNNFLVVA
jgi:Ca2+-binding RTX toxin-like protein